MLVPPAFCILKILYSFFFASLPVFLTLYFCCTLSPFRDTFSKRLPSYLARIGNRVGVGIYVYWPECPGWKTDFVRAGVGVFLGGSEKCELKVSGSYSSSLPVYLQSPLAV